MRYRVAIYDFPVQKFGAAFYFYVDRKSEIDLIDVAVLQPMLDVGYLLSVLSEADSWGSVDDAAGLRSSDCVQLPRLGFVACPNAVTSRRR